MIELDTCILPLGHCHSSSKKDQLKRRRRFQTKNVFGNTGSLNTCTIVAIIDANEIFLCKVSKSSEYPESVMWNTSVRVISTSRTERFDPREVIKEGFFPLFALEINGCNKHQRRAKLLPIEAAKTTNMVAKFLNHPSIPSSLVFRINSNEAPGISPLWMSYIKRQLVGLYLIYSKEVTTLIEIEWKGEIIEIKLESIICRERDTSVSLAPNFESSLKNVFVHESAYIVFDCAENIAFAGNAKLANNYSRISGKPAKKSDRC